MKRLMIALAASAAIASSAFADDDWFNGNIGGTASGGSWTSPLPDGATLESNKYVLDGVEDELAFTATTQKSLSSSDNLIFATSAKFSSAYDELPEIPSDAKAGVIAYEGSSVTTYYVLAKKDSTSENEWVDTEVEATLDSAVAVTVTITNGTDGAHALYKFGDSAVVDKVVYVADASTWGAASYLGSGEVASLVGTIHSNGYPIPGGQDPIPQDTANQWADDNGYSQDDLAEMLADTTTYTGNRTAAESCILGVATNAVITSSVADTNASVITFSVNCTPISGRATFTLKKNGTAVGEAQSSPDFEIGVADADGKYTIIANVDNANSPNKDIPVSQTIGVKSTAVGSGAVAYIAVPWSNCEAGDLLKNSICANLDKLEAYDPDSNSYKTWQYNGSAWEYAGTDTEPTLVKGQAVKYTRAGGNATMVAIGDVSSATTTAIKKGAAKWNLVAMPEGGAIKASKLPLDSTTAQAIVLGNDGRTLSKMFYKSSAGIKYRTSYDGKWTLVGDSDTVEGGFFLKTINTESIDWSK